VREYTVDRAIQKKRERERTLPGHRAHAPFLLSHGLTRPALRAHKVVVFDHGRVREMEEKTKKKKERNLSRYTPINERQRSSYFSFSPNPGLTINKRKNTGQD
jgi:hypothetical protein